MRFRLTSALLLGLLGVVAPPPAQAGTIDTFAFTPAPVGVDPNQNAWLYAYTVTASGLSNDCANQAEGLADGMIVNAAGTFSGGLGVHAARFPACTTYGTAITQSLTGLNVIGLPPDQTFTVSLSLRLLGGFINLGGGPLTFGPITRTVTTPSLVCQVTLVTGPGALRSEVGGVVDVEVQARTTVGGFPCALYFATVELLAQPPGAQGFAFLSDTRVQLDAQGRTRFRIRLGDKDGVYTLRIGCTICGGPPPVVPIEVPLPAGPAVVRTLAIAAGQGQEGTVAQALDAPLVVRVTEASTPTAGVSITWQVTGLPAGAGAATLSAATTQTDAQGRAQTGLTLGTRRGTYQVVATCPACEPTQVTFTAQAVLTVKIEMLSPPEVQPLETLLQPGETTEAAVQVRVTGAQGRAGGWPPRHPRG